MMPHGASDDTIFALASGLGRTAISVVRVSGPASGQMLARLCGSVPKPRVASLRSLRNDAGALLDRALVLWLPAPGSYTGEDSAELHLHGGRAVLSAVTDALLACAARPAGPGEFTRRALHSGRIDLLEAEGIADLIEAETSGQRLQALRQMDGEQSRLMLDWSERVLRSLAWQEALIDFADEDLPDVEQEMLDQLAGLAAELRRHIALSHQGERLRRGLVCVISGAPNVGKSSLLNSLAGHEAAIVSATPGTTRDAVMVELSLAGIPVTLVDTAGLRETTDEIEAEGVRRARAHSAKADFVIDLVDATSVAEIEPVGNHLRVANKVDLAPAPPGYLGVSVLSGLGLPELLANLESEALRLSAADTCAVFNRARHRAALADAEAGIASAVGCASADLRAEELRLVLQAFGRITGEVETDSILDVVFSTFCIGK